jgi:sulfite reductase alpha subunit-like flavoprotein
MADGVRAALATMLIKYDPALDAKKALETVTSWTKDKKLRQDLWF